MFSSEQNSLPDAVYIPVGETINNTSKINRILVISAEEKQSREGR